MNLRDMTEDDFDAAHNVHFLAPRRVNLGDAYTPPPVTRDEIAARLAEEGNLYNPLRYLDGEREFPWLKPGQSLAEAAHASTDIGAGCPREQQLDDLNAGVWRWCVYGCAALLGVVAALHLAAQLGVL